METANRSSPKNSRRWWRWFVASLVLALAPIILQYYLSNSEPSATATGNGIVSRAYGIFFASNVVIVEDDAKPPDNMEVEAKGAVATNKIHIKK